MVTAAHSPATAAAPATRSAERQPLRLARPDRSSLLLVANANASGLGGGRETIEQAASLLRALGAGVEVRWTASPGEFDELVSEEERRLVLVGGDGTLHALANAHGHRPEAALLPRGRANNIAHALGVPLDLDAAARLAVDGVAVPLDGISVEAPGVAMTAVEGVSVGFHAQARARYRGVNSADTAAGVTAAVAALARFRPVSLALDVDGRCALRRLGQLFVVNLPFFGPRLRVAPEADPRDGALEVVEVEAPRRSGLALAFARFRRAARLEHKGVRIRPARRIRIATRGQSPVVADTTVFSSGPVDLAVRPDSLRLVVPTV